MSGNGWWQDDRYESVQQAVRAYRPSALLPALAEFAGVPHVRYSLEDMQRRTPWAVAGLAKESIVRGNEHRSKAVGSDTVSRLVHRFNNAYEPPDFVESIPHLLAPLVFEQMPYQEADYTDLARTRALFVDTPLPARAGADVSDWSGLLGMSLDLASQATFLLWVWATHNQGRVDLALLDAPHMAGLLRRIPRDIVERTVARLSATVAEAKADYERQPSVDARLERFAYNPLSRTPLIDLGAGLIVAPQPDLIRATASPASLYYVGAQAWGDRFLGQLGDRFEAYVGRQLGSVSVWQVYPEVTYGRPQRKSVDWLLVHPDAVILIECKLGRPVMAARVGDESFIAKYVEKLDTARRQVNATVAELEAGNPAFNFVPADVPMIALVVTFEQFYMANDRAVTEKLTDASIPTLYASVKDLENLLALPPSRIVPFLQELVVDAERSTWSLGQALAGETPLGRNQILEEAWEAMDFVAKNATS